MITYKLCQVIVQDAHREARKNHLVKKTNIFDQNFTNYGDYVPGTGINDREPAIETAVDKISEDILLAVVSGW